MSCPHTSHLKLQTRAVAAALMLSRGTLVRTDDPGSRDAQPNPVPQEVLQLNREHLAWQLSWSGGSESRRDIDRLSSTPIL